MSIKEKIDRDLKSAMLARDRELVTTLRGLKSAILYAEISNNNKMSLDESELIKLLERESKKRQESADLYKKGGNLTKASSELNEKVIIKKYLPEELTHDEIVKLISEGIDSLPADKMQIGQVISYVKQKATGTVDGSLLARLVKERIGQ